MILRESLAMIAAFSFLIFFPKKRLPLGLGRWSGAVLLITGLILAVGAGQSAAQVLANFTRILTSPPTVKTISVILQIGILSALMKHYGVLDRLVEAFKDVFASPKTIMMALPAAIGMLSVPGGAALSSPFIFELGEQMGLPLEQRAAVNLTFRHMAYFLLPTSSSMLVLANLAPGISLYQLIGLNAAYIALMELTSYALYLRRATPMRREATGRRAAGLVDIARYLSPIYFIVLLNGVFGVPMELAVFASLMLILAMWGRHDLRTYARVFVSGFSCQTLVMMLGIYYMQNTVRGLGGILSAFTTLFEQSSGPAVLLVIAAASALFGLTTGLSYVPLGVLVPLLLGLHLPARQELVYCFFIYVWSFTGYFFSPLHLCQALTLEQMGAQVNRLDRIYLPLILEMAVSSFALFSIYRVLLG